ncbi:MAG: ATP-dependent helicase [Clostridium sp.]|uniref:ATP-dependent helicase n=1 Tax=Clostridium sp. TaxID=1506 RepID=UPI003062477D
MNENRFDDLSEEQIKAITCTHENILVSAGPGSGKTVVIVNRVYDLIYMKKVFPKNIIVITFTKAAANNMKKRFMKMTNNTVSPFFGTFHGLCYKILKSYYGSINIIESWESYKVIKNFLTTYVEEVSDDRIKEYTNALSIYKCKGIYTKEGNISIDEDILKNCFNFYEAYKKERELLDFEDLQVMCKELFCKNSRILDYYKNQFKHILVDEFQDSDDVQIEILRLLKGDNNLFVVGDEDQCIYSFRGANPSYMVKFSEKFSEGKILYLSTNYRSKKNIVDLSMKSIKNNFIRNPKTIIANKKDNGIIKFQGVRDETLQGAFISDYILKIKESSSKEFSDFAVIYRTNMESRSIIDNFIRKNIPFTLLDKQYNFFSHFICQDILAYLKLSIYPFNFEYFTRIINKPYRYISKNSLDIVKKDISLNNPFIKLKKIKSVPVFQLRLLDKLECDIGSLNKMSLQTAVDFIIGDLMYHKYLVEYGKKYSLSIEDLENVLNEFKDSVKGFKTIASFLEHVSKVEEETEKAIKQSKEKKEGVILSTIHGVKGMEFDTVFIINTVDGFIPYNNNDLEEERRLFYVGATRAINNLIFVAPEFISGEKRNKSRFLTECNLESEILGSTEFKVGMKVLHKFYGDGIIKSMDKTSISILFQETERKFDFTVLINNGLISLIVDV